MVHRGRKWMGTEAWAIQGEARLTIGSRNERGYPLLSAGQRASHAAQLWGWVQLMRSPHLCSLAGPRPPSQALGVLVNSGPSAPPCRRLLRVSRNEVPARAQVQQRSRLSAGPRGQTGTPHRTWGPEGTHRIRGCSCPRFRSSSWQKSLVGRLTILLPAGAEGVVSPW